MPAPLKALDLFAGTGWGVACRWLGIDESGVELMDEAVATRTANGMHTLYRDVWDGLEGRADVPAYDILIASPPCQTFSMAGKGSGRKALDEVLDAITYYLYKDPEQLREFGEKHDPRTALVLTPLSHIWHDLPQYVVLEQVPTVQPVWEAYAEVMRTWGYSVETAILNAEQFGVPQTRRRSILVARLDGPVSLPKPTHSRYYSRNPTKLDEGVLPWVSMAEALGWGRTDAPSHTITGGTHGPTDRWASGGAPARKKMDAKIGGPDWKNREGTPEATGRTEYADRFDVAEVATLQSYPAELPVTVRTSMGTPKVDGRNGSHELDPLTRPAHTLTTKADSWTLTDAAGGVRRLAAAEAAVLQSYPAELPSSGWGFTERPAVTVGNAVGRGLIGGSGAKETVVKALEDGSFIPSVHAKGDSYAEATRITVEEAAALQSYPSTLQTNNTTGSGYVKGGPRVPYQRGTDAPAPTVVSRADLWKLDGEKAVTPGEAATLQTFPPAPFVWCGTKSKVFLQIGNAVPPVLAAAVLSALLAPQQVPEPENLFDLI